MSRLVPRSGPPKDVPDALVIMGGPMSTNDNDAWIEREQDYIRTCVDAGIPVLGVCLGAQILATSFGGKVEPGPAPEIGILPVTLSKAAKDDPCFGDLPKTMNVFQWHSEGITQAPPKSVVLASSPDYPIQAFRVQDNVYGVLFHCEIDAQTVADPLPGLLQRFARCQNHCQQKWNVLSRNPAKNCIPMQTPLSTGLFHS